MPAPMLTMLDLDSTGSSSKYLQYVASLPANESGDSRGTSYSTSSGPKQSAQTYVKVGSLSAPHSRHRSLVLAKISSQPGRVDKKS